MEISKKYYLSFPNGLYFRVVKIIMSIFYIIVSLFFIIIFYACFYPGEFDILFFAIYTFIVCAFLKLLVYAIGDLLIGLKTNYFYLKGDTLIANIGFKEMIIPVDSISSVILTNNSNILKGGRTLWKKSRLPVFGYVDKRSGKILFYSICDYELYSLFKNLGIDVPENY